MIYTVAAVRAEPANDAGARGQKHQRFQLSRELRPAEPSSQPRTLRQGF